MNHFLFVLPLSALAVFIFLPFSQALVLCVSLFVVYSFFCRMAWKDWHRPATLGVEGMIGGIAQVMENGAGQVKVFYRGEIWDAICAEPVAKGEQVEISGMEHMKLIVKPGGLIQQME
jgi:membrane protein implicated in regulation of membrane protease activity